MAFAVVARWGGFETGHRFYGTETVDQELQDVLPRLNRLDSLLPQRMDPLLLDAQSARPLCCFLCRL